MSMPDPHSADIHAPDASVTSPAEMMEHLIALRGALWKRGFDVAISYPLLTARNHVAGGEPIRLLGPGLSQQVIVEDRGGEPWFSWVWSPVQSAERDASPGLPEYEPLCRTLDIDEASTRIS